MSNDLTSLLRAWGAGDPSVSETLFDHIYYELHSLAERHLRRQPEVTLTPTVLVNEAFLQLAADPKSDWRDRVQFFAFTATVMRRLAVAHARNRGAQKRGGGVAVLEFDEALHNILETGVDALALDEALTELAKVSAEQARIVELRFFAGLTVEETGDHLGISGRTVMRQWGMAKAWLADYLNGKPREY
jgi:RNA polymerase sigma-70 factor, ECF subfamily